MSSKLTIWSNASLPLEAMTMLKEGVGDHQLLLDDQGISNIGSGGRSHLLDEADIAFGQPNVDQAMEASKLRWIQLTSAGYTAYDRNDFRASISSHGAVLTNSSSVYDEPCAEHVLAFMLADARQLPQSFAEVGQWQMSEHRKRCRLLSDQKVLILGFGAIAKRIVELLAPFKLQVTALRQNVRGDEPIPVFGIDELDRLLPEADQVINVLPANPSTEMLITAERFSLMKPDAVFYNIGRGTTIDQDALVHSLTSGHLRAAYLDVTKPEPLPPENPLWSAPNCFITPHTAGGHYNESARLVEHFLLNLQRFESGNTLKDRVM